MNSTLTRRRALLSFLLVHALIFRAHAQLPEVLQSLDLSSLQTDYLWTGSLPDKLPPSAFDNALLNHMEAEQIIFDMRKSHLTGVEPYEELLAKKRVLAQSSRAVPIFVMEAQFNHFIENTLENGFISLEDGRLVDVENRSKAPYGSSETLVLSLDAETVGDQSMRFIWDPSMYYHNYNSFPELMRIDFNNGMGWIPLGNERSIFDVVFSTAFADCEVKLEVLRNGQWKRARTLLKSAGCSSNFPLPGTPPWPISFAANPWEIEFQQIKGNAYTLLSTDGVFDKPFIFVEGIDFGMNFTQLRNGDFGWCEFTGGSPDTYSMLDDMPFLLNELRERNYDIVLLDFSDGARLIEENASLLMHLVRLCIQFRQGNEPIVMAGASMGGQITRHALTTMEQNGEDHCTRLWVSLDSPHNGAYVPASLQAAIFMMSPFSAAASDMLVNKLSRPAAKQMLKYQLFDNPQTNSLFSPDYEAWEATKQVMGYPQKCVKVALANGVSTGAGLGYPLSEMLVDYECTFIPPNEDIQFHLYPLPGNSDHSWSNASEWVVADIVYTESLGIFNSGITGINQYQMAMTVSSEWPRWDYAAGGTRTSVDEFVDAFNNAEGVEEHCSLIQADQYNSRHCFIPTSSALGIKSENPFLNVNALLAQNREECPFDFYWTPLSQEEHSAVSEESITWLGSFLFANETASGDPLLPETLSTGSSPGNTFNFARPELATMESMTIENGGRVHVNGWMRSHYGTSSDPYPTIGSNFTLSTLPSCNQSYIEINQGGRLSVGNGAELTTATFVIENGGVVRVNNGGELIVYSGSRMVVREGGLLILEEGSELILDQSVIELEPGGQIHYHGGDFLLNGPSSRFVFSGGQLHVAQGLTFDPFRSEEECGFFDVRSFSDSDIFLYEGATLKLIGRGEDDLLVFIPNAYHLGIEGLGTAHIDIKDGLLDFTNGGVLAHSCHLSVVGCEVLSFENNANSPSRISCWGSSTSVQRSRFEGASIEAFDTKLSMLRTECLGRNSGVKMEGGDYSIESCRFVTGGVLSRDLSGPSRVRLSSFVNEQMGPFAISDKSNQTINMYKCSFENYSLACSKTHGRLSAKCCDWSRNNVCLFLSQDAYLAMGSSDGAGQNTFDVNHTLASFSNALPPNFLDGQNDFTGGFNHLFTGTIQLNGCTSSCNAVALFAHGNKWSANGLTGPNESLISLSTTDFCSSSIGCSVKVIDSWPVQEVQCSVLEQYDFSKNTDVESTADKGRTDGKHAAVLYPNPTSDMAFVSCSGFDGLCTITVYASDGRWVWSTTKEFNVVEEQITIPCVEWSAGIYHVSIASEGANESLRLLVE